MDMFEKKETLLFFCLVFILLSSRVTFAQLKQSSDSSQNEHTVPSTHLNASDSTNTQSKSTDQASLADDNNTQVPSSEDQAPVQQVIAHHEIQNNELSLNELRAIFSLRARKWPDGTPITVFVLRDEDEDHRQFLLKTLKMLPHQLRRQWDRFIYSGIGQGPTVVNSQEEMLKKIKATPGGVGYLAREEVLDATVHMLSIR